MTGSSFVPALCIQSRKRRLRASAKGLRLDAANVQSAVRLLAVHLDLRNYTAGLLRETLALWATTVKMLAILFAATILAARKLHEIGDKPCSARECAISDAITKAEQILKRIDERWPTKTD